MFLKIRAYYMNSSISLPSAEGPKNHQYPTRASTGSKPSLLNQSSSSKIVDHIAQIQLDAVRSGPSFSRQKKPAKAPRITWIEKRADIPATALIVPTAPTLFKTDQVKVKKNGMLTVIK